MLDSQTIRFCVRRFVLALTTLAGISVLSFCAVNLLPGDPVSSRYPQASESEIAAMRAEMGLDRPIHIQYLRYLSALSAGDLGWSYNTNTPVADDLRQRLPASLELAAAGLLLAVLIGVPLGIIAAVRHNRLADHLARVFSIGVLSIPVFWTGLVGIYVFSYSLRWAPAPLGRLPLIVTAPPQVTGFITIDSLIAGNGAAFGAALQSLALPATALGLSLVAPIARIMRAAMLEALQEDYVLFARATGVPEWDVVMRDALRGALVPVLTIVGYLMGYLVAGNALVETVFSWPGVGRYAVQAMLTSDMAPINAILLTLAVAITVTNFAVDLAYAAVDPRIRHGLMGT